jgi:CHRD domain
MKRVTIVATAVFVVAGTGFAFTDEGARRFREFLNGLQEAPAIVATTGTGTFRATISSDGEEINYSLTFRNLEGDVTQAHIHIGHPQNAGGIVLWLCQAVNRNPAPGNTTPECTENDPLDKRNGRVTGRLTAADVTLSPANGIGRVVSPGPPPVLAPDAGDFEEIVRLIRAGATYVNVHSTKFGPGEVRSQINNRDGDRDRHDH